MKKVVVDGESTTLSTRAHGLVQRLSQLEKSNRALARTHRKHSHDAARMTAVANAFNVAKTLFVETYGKP